MLTWNYRVIRTPRPNNEFEFFVHEVYYDAQGNPTSWSESPMSAMGYDSANLKRDLQHMLDACCKEHLEIFEGTLRVCTNDPVEVEYLIAEMIDDDMR